MSALVKGPLTTAEVEFLAQCEETIDAGMLTFVEVGQALMSIRENRLYRAEFPTFEVYCVERWQMSARRANQLVSAAEVVGTIVPTGLPVPANEGQTRELARVPEGQRADVWQKTLETTDGKPTAAAVRAAAEEVATPDQPADLPAEAADPAPVVADGTVPAVPSAPSPLEKYLAEDQKLPRTGWQKQFMAAIGRSFTVAQFTPDQVAEYADRELVEELRQLVTDLDDYVTRAEKAWAERNGLRVLKGGAA